jgi:hypothetical protein
VQINVSHQCDSAPICGIIDVISVDPDFENEDFFLQGENDMKLQLRAERNGKDKEGRIYELTVECMGDGQKNWFEIEIGVPHDMSEMQDIAQDSASSDQKKNDHLSNGSVAGPNNNSSNKPETPPIGAKKNNRPEDNQKEKIKKVEGNIPGNKKSKPNE